jgi:hypothetical protein
LNFGAAYSSHHDASRTDWRAIMQRKVSDRPPFAVPPCPVCHHRQTKVQRRLTATTNGSTMYVCTRSDQCNVGMNLQKMSTWVAV